MLTQEQIKNLPEDAQKEYMQAMLLLDKKKKEQKKEEEPKPAGL